MKKNRSFAQPLPDSKSVENIEDKINNLLNFFPVLFILGVRQSGKTYLANKLRPEWKYFDLENGSDYDYITNDYDFFFKENPGRFISLSFIIVLTGSEIIFSISLRPDMPAFALIFCINATSASVISSNP